MLLFVYGTLMRGERANHLLDRARFVEEATTRPHYRLVQASGSSHRDGYPGLVEGEQSVRGEIWEVPPVVLAELDRYEGVPWLYQRKGVAVAGYRTAQAYLFNRPTAGLTTIESGDWRKR